MKLRQCLGGSSCDMYASCSWCRKGCGRGEARPRLSPMPHWRPSCQVGAYQSSPALPSGEVPEDPKPAVAPARFRTLAGRGHAEFSSARQQDACEYFQHLLALLERVEHAEGARLGACPTVSSSVQLYQFATEDRIQCKVAPCWNVPAPFPSPWGCQSYMWYPWQLISTEGGYSLTLPSDYRFM